MLTREDLNTIWSEDIVDDIARSLEPLAFIGNDVEDMEKRRAAVNTLIYVAYKEYVHRERGLPWVRPHIMDMETEW